MKALASVARTGYRRRMDRAEHEPGFDSLRAAETLREAGVEDRQAKAPRLREGRLAGAVRDGRRGLATKDDIANLATKADLERAINQITWRMIALAGVVIAIVKLL